MQPISVKKILLLLVFSLLIIGYSFAAEIKGKVFDAITGEPLIGATVTLEKGEQKFTTSVNLDGSFAFRKMPAGKYELKIKYVGYESIKEVKIHVKDEKEIQNFTFNMNQKKDELKEIVVTSGANRYSDKYTRSLEKNADYVQNILSEKAIEISPDVTVANVLQRISGVTIQRSNNGEGKYAIIRGMDQRYNTTLVNGIKIPSPNDKYRYVPMNLFPSDLLERLEVIKALTPSMEGDATGGVMNLIMKNAPDKKMFHAFVAGGGNTLFRDRDFQRFDHSVISKLDPSELHGSNYLAQPSDFPTQNLNFSKQLDPINFQTGLTFGNRYFHKKLGFIVGVGFQNFYTGSNQILNTQYPGAIVLPNANGIQGNIYNNYPQFDKAINNTYSIQTSRLGINNKWDYAINAKNKISLFNMYVRQNEFEARVFQSLDVNTNLGNIANVYRSRWQQQTIYNSTLHGEHIINSAFNLNWDAVYSKAKQLVPDYASFEYDNKQNQDGSLKYPVQTGILKGMDRIWLHNSDRDLAGYLNLNYNTHLLNKNLTLSVGGMYRNKERNNYYHHYSLSPVNGGNQMFTTIANAQYSFAINGGDNGAGDQGIGRVYNITENVSAGYFQFKYQLSEKLDAVGGVRVEHTDQNYQTNLPLNLNAVYGHIYYTDLLPSLHLKYKINQLQNVRLSYFKSIARPSFVDLIPQLVPASENDAYDQQGNPFIKHTQVDNLDLRYELFPQGADQILIGAFTKFIQNPIETSFSHYSVFGGNSAPGTNILTPLNAGNVTNYGVELVFTKYIGKFGINANYTYTHSNTTTQKFYLYYDATQQKNITISKMQSRPLQGQAKHIGNLSLLFKDPKTGIDMQLAYVYTGERLTSVNSFYNLDTWQSPFSQLDFSFEKKIVKRVSIYGKINNLTNSQTRFFLKQPYLIGNTLNKIPGQDDPAHSIFVERDTYGVSYLLGVRFKL